MIGVLFSLLIKAQPSVILPASNSQPRCPLYVNCCRDKTRFQMPLLQRYVRWDVRFTCKLNPLAMPSRYSFPSLENGVQFKAFKYPASSWSSRLSKEGRKESISLKLQSCLAEMKWHTALADLCAEPQNDHVQCTLWTGTTANSVLTKATLVLTTDRLWDILSFTAISKLRPCQK